MVCRLTPHAGAATGTGMVVSEIERMPSRSSCRTSAAQVPNQANHVPVAILCGVRGMRQLRRCERLPDPSKTAPLGCKLALLQQCILLTNPEAPTRCTDRMLFCRPSPPLLPHQAVAPHLCALLLKRTVDRPTASTGPRGSAQ